MKIKIAFPLLFLFILFKVNGQKGLPAKSASYKIAYSQKSNAKIFLQHKDLKKIVIGYEEDTPVSVYAFYPGASVSVDLQETFDLGYKGDDYLFEKKYGHRLLPSFKNSKVPSFPDFPNGNCQDVWITKQATLTNDSVIYELRVDCFAGQKRLTYRRPYIGYPGKYSGDLNVLAKKIADLYHSGKRGVARPKDSILIIRYSITKDKTLNNGELISGKTSKFLDAVQTVVEDPANKWTPANIGGVFLTSFCRFYASLNRDGSVTLLTPRRLLNAAGW